MNPLTPMSEHPWAFSIKICAPLQISTMVLIRNHRAFSIYKKVVLYVCSLLETGNSLLHITMANDIIKAGTIAFVRSLAPAASRLRIAATHRIRFAQPNCLQYFSTRRVLPRHIFMCPHRILLRTSSYSIVLFQTGKGRELHDHIQGVFLP